MKHWTERITPDNIQELKPNEIFVFGSNLSGIHGGGAAKLAHQKFGAKWEEGVGLFGQSYAIPTKSRGIARTLTLGEIRPHVDNFLSFCEMQYIGNKVTFLVTEIGCGLAGYNPIDIAPMFRYAAITLDNIYLPKRFWDILNNQ